MTMTSRTITYPPEMLPSPDEGDEAEVIVRCPKCGQDITIEPGRVYRCAEPQCAFWRVGFDGDAEQGDEK